MEQSTGRSDVTDQENGELAGAIRVASERLLRAMGEFEQTAGRPTQTGTSTVNVNAGGTGLLIAIGCCIAVTVFFFAGAIVAWMMVDGLRGELADTRAEIRTMRQSDETQQAYINLLMQERPSK